MNIPFRKGHGTGNDFIIADNRDHSFPVHKILIADLCHRRFGIGADGLMLLENSPHSGFGMRYFNADGGEGSMCGNGGRCIAAFASHMGVALNEMTFSAVDGIHHARILATDDKTMMVSLRMQDVDNVSRQENFFLADTGSPHYVEFVESVEIPGLMERGKQIRYSPAFAPGGVNVNFACFTSQGIKMRTYERGVENETLSCGTGSVAVALAASILRGGGSWKILAPGGELQVDFIPDKTVFREVNLQGPATRVFSGTIQI